MKNKKIYFSNNLALLRNKKNYLHSTDIFEQIIDLNKNFTDLKINFRKQIKNFPYIILSPRPSASSQSKSSVYFSYKKLKRNNFGYIFETKKKLYIKKNYTEKAFQKKVKIFKNLIKIPNFKKFNFIEKITSSAMKLLKVVSPEKNNKWFLVSLNLNKFNNKSKFENLELFYIKKIEKIYFFEIISKKSKIGNMVFIKK